MSFLFLALLGCIVIVIINSRINKLKEKIDGLEWELRLFPKLTHRLDHLEKEILKLTSTDIISGKQKNSGMESEIETPNVPITPTVEPLIQSVEQKTNHPEIQVEPPSITAASTNSPEINKPFVDVEKPKSHTREEWESFVGGKLLNRIGALALIIGLGFFMKYAFDNNLISETVRVLIGFVVGFTCIVFAYRTHKKGFQIFAQGLIGAGIAILYLTVYASFNYYSLVPQWLAFLMMSCVTALSLALGIHFNSRVVGLFGWMGGFLTPIMLSTGSANEIGLFTYIALLNVGLLAIVFMKKNWQILEPLTLISTWIMYWAWYFKFYNETDLLITVFFVSIFWFLFFGLDIARLRLLGNSNTYLQHAVAVLNTIIYYTILYHLIDFNYHSWMAGVTIILAGMHVGIFLWLNRHKAVQEIVIIRYVLTAITLAVLATAIHFENFRTVIGWSIEAAALLWFGIQWRKSFVWFAAIFLFILAIVKLSATQGAFLYIPIESFRLLLNERCLTFIVLTASLCSSAYRLPKIEDPIGKYSNYFHSTWCAVLFTLLTVETIDYFQYHILYASTIDADKLVLIRSMVLAIVWLIFSIPLMWIGSRQKLIPLITSSIVALSFAVCILFLQGLAFEPLREFLPVLNIRSSAFIIVIIGTFFHYRQVKTIKSLQSWIEIFRSAALYLLSILLFTFITIELNDYFRWRMLDQYESIIETLKFSRPLVFSMAWTMLAVIFFRIGLRRYHTSLIQSALCLLVLAACAFIVRGLIYEPIQEFTPVINIRSAALFVLLIGIFFHYFLSNHTQPKPDWNSGFSSVMRYSFSIFLFIFLTIEINDYIRYLMINKTDTILEMLTFSRLMIFSAVWTVFSLLLVWIGQKKNWTEFVYSGLSVLFLGICFAIIRGIEFEPIASFRLILNIRFICGLIVVAVIFIHQSFLSYLSLDVILKNKIAQAFQIGIIILSLVVFTGETHDYFQREIITTQASGDILKHLDNLMQLSLSTVWLLYSMALMALGFWRSLSRIRIIAFVLFGFTILKIFIYDLSYLETLYRIYSFIGLGIILIAVSYAYQRYKYVVFGTGKQKD
jgi:uncharacterized membrane protein